jgi:hypothetical protein
MGHEEHEVHEDGIYATKSTKFTKTVILGHEEHEVHEDGNFGHEEHEVHEDDGRGPRRSES